MSTPEGLGFRRPTGTDLISTGDNDISKNAEVATALYDSLVANISDADFVKPPVTSSVDFNTLTTPGLYPIQYAANANGPGRSGALIVGESGNPTLTQIGHLMLGEPGELSYRSSRNGVWTDWQLLGEGNIKVHPPLGSAVDLKTVVEPGFHPVPYSGNPNGPKVSGTLLVLDAGHPTISFLSQTFYASDNGGMYSQTARNGVWSGWSEAGTPQDATDKGAARHAMLLSEFKRRRGGRIGTAGRGVVSLRFDHHLQPFREQILPLLEQYGLPWGQAYNYASPSPNDDMTFSAIELMCINSGGEIANHGRNHGDAPTPGAMRREIVQPLGEFKAAMPDLAVEWFAIPGLAGGYGGNTDMRSVDQMDTLAGRFMYANHAVVSGYMGGHYRPLSGDPVYGAGHYTVDNGLGYHWVNAVNRAIDTGTALALMLHPSALLDGQTTITAVQQGLAHIAAKRDAGELVVLSPTGSLLADASSAYRRNLLGVTSLTAGVPLVLNTETLQFQGAIHELTVSGATTLTVSDSTGKLNATVTGTGPVTRMVFNVPLTASTVTVTSTAAVTNALLTAA